MHGKKCTALFLSAMAVASAGKAQERSNLAQELANPIAVIISVPFQLNYDDNLGINGVSAS